MPSAFDVLRKDHEKVRRMLSELETGPTRASGANPDQLTLREKMVQQLIIEESRHEAVEEMYFWPIVRDRLTDGKELTRHALDQERQGTEVLDRLDKLEAGDGEFEMLLGELISAGRAHIAFEEAHVWPQLRLALTAQEADELGQRIEEGKKTAPTRPHPGTPRR